MGKSPRLEIEYCTQCGYLPRATWMAQELLTTFGTEFGGVELVPSSGGVFEVRLEGEMIWSRKDTGSFPEPMELEGRLQDRVVGQD